MTLLSEVFDKQLIKLDLIGETKDKVFEELIEAISTVHPQLDRQELLDAVQSREQKLNTSVMSGVAIPHGYCRNLADVIGAIGISRAGVSYGALDHKPVHVFFLLIMGEGVREKHLHVLSKILNLLNSGVLYHLMMAQSSQEIYDILVHFY
jgi:mannitol/fructose-specific phosphotransferase system IIA component (Ntr-type)